jgi:hypothetical protein
MNEAVGWAAVLCLFACAACGDDETVPVAPVCTLAFVGKARDALALVPVQRTASGMLAELEDGGALDVVFPPQGGRVAFVGVRARNVDPCEVTLKGVLRDTASNKVRFDTRITNLMVDGEEARSDEREIATFSNIPLCPNQWSSADVFDQAYELEIVLTERGGRKLERTLAVTPRCAEPEREAACKCMCKHGYELGEPCGEDVPPP